MQIEFRESFEKDIAKIKDKKLSAKINFAIHLVEAAATIESIAHIKKLRGHKNSYRVRIGDYRLGVQYENEILTFVRCLHRKDIYKYFP